MALRAQILEVQGKHLRVSNLDKVLYPETGFTKAQVMDYYVRVAPVLLPHLRNRPLTMKRYPDGVNGEYFYEKNCPKHRPEWVQTAPIWSDSHKRWQRYCLAQDLPTLVWMANLADLELHVSLSTASDILQPTMIVFDLDPGAPANIVQCCQVALWVQRIFDHFGLEAYPKTSGSKGLQVYAPLNTPVSYDQTKGFAKRIAQLLERARPELVVSDMKKSARVGRIFVDWSQNDEHKTTISVYSLRARERPTVSAPVTWKEVETCLKKQDANLLTFDSSQVLERVDKRGDLFQPVLQLQQQLPEVAALDGSLVERLVASKTVAVVPASQKKKRSTPSSARSA